MLTYRWGFGPFLYSWHCVHRVLYTVYLIPRMIPCVGFCYPQLGTKGKKGENPDRLNNEAEVEVRLENPNRGVQAQSLCYPVRACGTDRRTGPRAKLQYWLHDKDSGCKEGSRAVNFCSVTTFHDGRAVNRRPSSKCRAESTFA